VCLLSFVARIRTTGAILLLGAWRFGVLFCQMFLYLLTDLLPHAPNDVFDLIERLVGVGELGFKLLAETTDEFFEENFAF
jgi:hypothetical protein